MLRNITAGVAGIVAGVVLISLVQWISHVIVPLPPGFDAADPEALARLVAQMPPLAFILLELSYVAGALASGFVAARLARTRPMALALVMGGVFTLFNIANQLQIPHPAWLAVLTTVTFLPLAWLGGRLALGFRPSARGEGKCRSHSGKPPCIPIGGARGGLPPSCCCCSRTFSAGGVIDPVGPAALQWPHAAAGRRQKAASGAQCRAIRPAPIAGHEPDPDA